MSTISDETLASLLSAEQCGPEFIEEALRYKKFYDGDVEGFIEKVETILYALENSDDEKFTDDDDDYDDGFEDDDLDDYDHYDDMDEASEDEEDEERD